MDNNLNLLEQQLQKCRNTINKGYINIQISDLNWLNNFCNEFLQFANILHGFINTKQNNDAAASNEHVQNVYLCLTQIVTCIKHMERVIKAEQASRQGALSATRQHFLDRIHWCLTRLRDSLRLLDAVNANGNSDACAMSPLEEQNYVQLMDQVFDYLDPFSNDKEDSTNSSRNISEENAEIMLISKKIRSLVNLILGHTLAFANVALKDDKKALSALCQKVLRVCSEFQQECALDQPEYKANICNRKLKAMSLENALYQLEDFINESLLRLVYTCFLDYDKYSVSNLRSQLRAANNDDDPAVDELIADFDVNVDRTTQIGIFAIAFAPNMKMKTIVRSCLASLESLDACLVPALQTNISDLHSEILEQHFNEEITIFKHTLNEIIDSTAFVGCYLEMLNACIATIEREFNKLSLQNIAEMGAFLSAHFQIKVNKKHLQIAGYPERKQHFEQFELMLRECKAILMCADQVDTKRIVKRFKIMRNILRKLHESLNDSAEKKEKSELVFIMSDELSDNECMFESVGIMPSMCSILYGNDNKIIRRTKQDKIITDSMRGNYSKLETEKQPTEIKETNKNCADHRQPQRCSVRRNESLRTAMFKRQNMAESEKIYGNYKNQSNSLQISDILDQLSNISNNTGSGSRIELIASI